MKYFNMKNKYFKRVAVLAPVVASSLLVTASAADPITLPDVDLGTVTTWIVGIGATMIMIAASIFAVKKAQRFLGG